MPCLSFDISFWTTYTGASLMLDKLFNRSRFYGIVCFLILASGPHLNATITSYIFSEVPVLMLLYPIVDHLYGCFSCFRRLLQKVQDSAFNPTFKLLFIVVFFPMVHNKKLFGRSSAKYRTFSESPS